MASFWGALPDFGISRRLGLTAPTTDPPTDGAAVTGSAKLRPSPVDPGLSGSRRDGRRTKAKRSQATPAEIEAASPSLAESFGLASDAADAMIAAAMASNTV